MQESFIKHYVISAFCLKLLDIVVLILSQVNMENNRCRKCLKDSLPFISFLSELLGQNVFCVDIQ